MLYKLETPLAMSNDTSRGSSSLKRLAKTVNAYADIWTLSVILQFGADIADIQSSEAG